MRLSAVAAALFVCSAWLCSGGAGPAAAQPAIEIPRVQEPPRLEDYLDGRSRPDEARVSDFLQREPADGVPASQQTTAYLSYDDRHLYVIFVCADTEPGRIRARLTRREAIFGDDIVGVLLDTFHDRQRAYLFLANPLGIQLDGVVTEGQNDDFSFDTLWRSDGRVTENGYVVWMAIPFRSLRFPDAPEQTWGIAFGRIIPRANETSFWPYVTRRVAGFGQQFATMRGLRDVSPGRNVQLIPYGVFTGARFLDPAGPSFTGEREGRAGLDAKVVLRDAFTLDLALNPDFSQVESDEPQVTINQRFEVFFPEKRPFFIENAGFFETPINLFFSRRIADPGLGTRLTGKIGPWAVAALVADDRAPGRLAADASGRRTAAGVFRLQREFPGQSSVGVLATTRDFADTSNRIAGIDGRLRLNPNWFFVGQAVASRTQQADGDALSGPALQAELRRSGRSFQYTARYIDRAPGFRSHLGFVPRVDVRQVEQGTSYNWLPGGSVERFGPGVFALANWDRQGELHDWRVSPNFLVSLLGQTFVRAERTEAFERFQGGGFRKHATRLNAGTERLQWLSVFGGVTIGTELNFFPAAGLDPFVAASRSGFFTAVLRPTAALRLDQTYIHSSLRVNGAAPPAVAPPGAYIFNNHILRTRAGYQFTRELSMRAIVDYNAVLPNPTLVALSRRKRLSADILFTYLLNPGTAIYIGYADRYEDVALEPDDAGGRRLRRFGAPSTSTGRQFFVKSSYLLRF